MQVHCIPRPSKAGTKRPVYDCPTKFSFHHVNAFEAPDGAVVVDTVGRHTIDFGAGLREFKATSYDDPAGMTTIRRIVCRGSETRATEHDMRAVPALRNRVIEFAAQMPADVVGQPHDVAIYGVRSGSDQRSGCMNSLLSCRASRMVGAVVSAELRLTTEPLTRRSLTRSRQRAGQSGDAQIGRRHDPRGGARAHEPQQRRGWAFQQR